MHAVQDARPPTLAVPTAHGVHVVAFTALYEPPEHGVHTDAFAPLDVPAAQPEHETAPATLNLPATHPVHCVALDEAENRPAGHKLHIDAPLLL